MSVEVSMKMSPREAGKLYVKSVQLEEEVDRLRDTLARVKSALEADIDNRFAAFEKWKSDYALQSEPNYSLETEYDCTEAFLAGIEFASGSVLKALEGEDND